MGIQPGLALHLYLTVSKLRYIRYWAVARSVLFKINFFRLPSAVPTVQHLSFMIPYKHKRSDVPYGQYRYFGEKVC